MTAHERTGFRDEALSRRHREWGINCPAVDVDWLLTRPTKRSDTRSHGWVGDSVDVDAIAPSDLRAIVGDAITRNIDSHALDLTLMAEREEREFLESILTMGGA